MHLIFENLIPNLVLHYTGGFKGFDTGTESYQLHPSVWEEIGKATAASGSTIPSQFGRTVRNIASNKGSFTAEAWSFWTLYLAPVLLRNRFLKDTYFKHFIKLVRLLNMCLDWEYSTAKFGEMREGFVEWVEEYEK
jgi:hypothetical protein